MKKNINNKISKITSFGMKKLFTSILISLILLTNFIIPITAVAADPVPTIKFGPVEETTQSSSGLRAWYFKVNTTNINDGGVVSFKIDEEGSPINTGYISTKITKNVGEYYTGFILKPGTLYKITAMSNPAASVSFEQKTGGTAVVSTNIIDKWWFVNEAKQVVGSNGVHGFPGFSDKKTCEAAEAPYKSTVKSSIGECFQETDANINKLIEAEKAVSAAFTQNVINKDESVPVDAQINVAENKTIYNMLAPIGQLKTMNPNTGGCAPTDPTCIGNNVGDYLNIIFKFAIGIAAALAVIMLILSGVQYMGDESIFGKTEAKSKMYSAILGLLIALGAWALLNTISPALTGKGGVNIDTANIEIETQPLISNDAFQDGTTTPDCLDGIVMANTINGGIPICKNLSEKLIAMIAKSKTDGINLFGYGYRSKSKQEALRSQNCGGQSNIYNQSAKCTPLTAMPGKSLHENGLAVDFTCDGQTIKAKDNKCYVWLKSNSTIFKNLEAEPWHWSTTGR